MEKIATDTYSFVDIRQGGFVYVDKTAILKTLAEEVKANFPESLAALGAKHGLDAEATFAKLVHWYDGYLFEENAAHVFNPVSVGKCLSTRKFDPFWFETGTPSFLLRLMEKNPVTLDDIEVSQTAFSVYEPDRPALMSLLYQTGVRLLRA